MVLGHSWERHQPTSAISLYIRVAEDVIFNGPPYTRNLACSQGMHYQWNESSVIGGRHHAAINETNRSVEGQSYHGTLLPFQHAMLSSYGDRFHVKKQWKRLKIHDWGFSGPQDLVVLLRPWADQTSKIMHLPLNAFSAPLELAMVPQ